MYRILCALLDLQALLSNDHEPERELLLPFSRPGRACKNIRASRWASDEEPHKASSSQQDDLSGKCHIIAQKLDIFTSLVQVRNLGLRYVPSKFPNLQTTSNYDDVS